MWLYINIPNRKIRIHSQCLTSKKSTGFESQCTRFTRTARTAYRGNTKVVRLKRERRCGGHRPPNSADQWLGLCCRIFLRPSN